MVLLAFENVSKSYGSTPALEHINLDQVSRKNYRLTWSKWLWKNNHDKTNQRFTSTK